MKNEAYKSAYEQIRKASQSNQLVVFIGAGMSNNFGFPTWNGLVRSMYEEYTGRKVSERKAFSSEETLRIPQALREKDRKAYDRILKDNFGPHRVLNPDNVILDEIMKLRPKHIITTNFDVLIERYLQDKDEALSEEHSAKEGYGKLVHNHIPYRYMTVVNDGDMIAADANHLLLKIHGDVQNMDSLVLCEDDYLEYSDSHILMENFIKSLLINHTFLFVGYSVGDPNLKLIMKWVDTIASRQKIDATKRKKHYLLYPEKKSMDEMHRTYMRQKQIEVLEVRQLPKALREDKISEFANFRGNNILALLRALTVSDTNTKITGQKLSELFTYFEKRKVVHVWEITEFLGVARYEIEKTGTKLQLYPNSQGSCLMEAVFRLASSRKAEPVITDDRKSLGRVEPVGTDSGKSLGRAELAKTDAWKSLKKEETVKTDAREFLGKVGIDGYFYCFEYELHKLPQLQEDFVEKACLTSNYEELYTYVKKNPEYSYAEKANWALYTDQKAEADRWFKKQWNSRQKLSLYEQLRYAHNLQQEFELQEAYDVDLGLLWNSLPDEEQKKQCLMQEYAGGYSELYSAFGKAADELRLRCYSDRSYRTTPYEADDFERCRTTIIDYLRTMILNGYYVTGLWPMGCYSAGLENLMRAYADMILFLLSPECRLKPDKFRLCSWDLFILINMVETDDLSRMKERYKIEQLDVEQDIQRVLCENFINLLNFAGKSLTNKDQNGHLCSRRLKNCLLLMNLIRWNEEQAVPLVECIFSYLCRLVVNDRSSRAFYVQTNTLYDFLKNGNMNQYKTIISPHAEKLFKLLLQRFLQEDHLNQYSRILQDNVEWYGDMGMAGDLVDQSNHSIPANLITKTWKCYHEWYGGTTSFMLVQIYPFATAKVKAEIAEHIAKRLKGMDILLLRACIEMDILQYSLEIEAELMSRCQRFATLSDRQRGNSGNKQSPLTHILRLWQNGKISNIGTYKEFKELDPWFSFVCFPEEFDYEQFDVAGWCTWLSKKDYREEAFRRNKSLLKKKFEEAIRAGADEEVKKIYYKYLE